MPILLITIAIWTLVGVGAFVRPAVAQEAFLALKDVKLSIYPEYDDLLNLGGPSLLVMIDGEIEGLQPPVTVRFLVPSSALMYSAGSGPRASYIGGPPDRKASDINGWDEISYTLQTNIFVVEYYVPIRDTQPRNFSGGFIPLYPVDGLVAEVMQPRETLNFSVQPGTAPANQLEFTDPQGFNHKQYTYESLASRQSLDFSLSYTKNESSSSNVTVIVILVVVGVGIIGAILYRALKKSQAASRGDRRRQNRAARKSDGKDAISAKKPAGRKPAGKPRFCPDCGVELEGSPRFCPDCGSQLRD
ncbi:MAG: zinc ribbon domain-containing protein [Acidobacteriota bacterium]